MKSCQKKKLMKKNSWAGRVTWDCVWGKAEGYIHTHILKVRHLHLASTTFRNLVPVYLSWPHYPNSTVSTVNFSSFSFICHVLSLPNMYTWYCLCPEHFSTASLALLFYHIPSKKSVLNPLWVWISAPSGCSFSVDPPLSLALGQECVYLVHITWCLPQLLAPRCSINTCWIN